MVLFSVKRSTPASLGLAVGLVVGALAVSRVLGLAWDAAIGVGTATWAAAILAGLLLSDALGHAVLGWLLGESYEGAFDRLVGYFAGQTVTTVLAGGLLAAAEELVFRGVVLVALVQVADLPAIVAVGVAAIAFGLSHVVREPDLRVFAVWATWEGLALGAAFVVSGSLLAVAFAHAAHDVVGFVVFARRRRDAGV